MGYPLYRIHPDAIEVVLHSNNPLLYGEEITLEQYYVTIELKKGKDGEESEKVEVPCVTHESLKQYFQRNLAPFGYTESYSDETPSTFKDTVAKKCVISKVMKTRDKKRLLKADPEATIEDLDFTYHIEDVGSASPDNLTSEIARKHPIETATNRAFDRCFIKFLCLDTVVYGSYEEIGEEEVSNLKNTKRRTDWLERAFEDDAPKAEQTKMDIPSEPSENTVPAIGNSEGAKEIHSHNVCCPEPDDIPDIGQHNEKDPLHTIIKAIHCLRRADSYDKTLTSVYHGNGLYNSKTYAQIVAALLETGDTNAATALTSIVSCPPAKEEFGQEYINLIQLLIDKGRLLFVDKKLVIR